MSEQSPRIPPESVVAVIPARYGSSRFSGKPLADLNGRPLIAHVIAAAEAAQRIGTVLVATDHEKIAQAAREAGALAVMTRADHLTGSDRIGEVIAGRREAIIVNVQGDEPLIPSRAIDRLVELLEENLEASVSTLASPLDEESATHADPNVVKVVRDTRGYALYFSRAAIPGRHPSSAPPQAREERAALRHVGIYAFRREAFESFLGLAPGPLERHEGLEQLRFLEHGMRIVVGLTEALPPGVDTPADLARVRSRLRST